MKILVIDDHAVVRQGVRRLLSVFPEAVIEEAETVAHAEEAIRNRAPDIVVLDINLPDGSGLDLLRRLQTAAPQVRIVVFSMYSDAAYAASARRAGALGYVSKSAPSDELVEAVERAARGEPHVDAETAAALGRIQNRSGEGTRQLSPRELEVFTLLADGESLSGIAEKLDMAYKTVANTCTRIREKLGLERNGDLVRLAVESRHTKV